jgi:hypothetical protein
MKKVSLKMKSVLAVALLALGMTFAAAPKANAGVILALTVSGEVGSDIADFGICVDLVTFLVDITHPHKSREFASQIQNDYDAGIIFIVLDANASGSEDSIANLFSNQFPFVDNAAIAQDFAVKAKAKLAIARANDPSARGWDVKFTPAETAALLAPAQASITAEQASAVVAALQ